MPGEANEEFDVALEYSKMILEASTKNLESSSCKTNYCCVFAGVKERKGRQIQNYIIEKEEKTLSHDDEHYLYHFLLSDVEMEQ